MNPPQIVSAAEWEAARKALLVKEKQATPARDVLAAERRRLPMVRVEKDDRLQRPNGEARLVDLFDRRRQLIVYQFMFAPGVGGWPDAGCDGCSLLVDNVGHLARLRARDTSFVLVSRAPLGNIQHHRERIGWTIPWFSSAGSDFNVDLGLTSDAGETFGLSVLLRDGEDVVRTYFPQPARHRGPGQHLAFLDLTPLGRQEDLPEGYPQTPPDVWWRRHDEYDDATTAAKRC